MTAAEEAWKVKLFCFLDLLDILYLIDILYSFDILYLIDILYLTSLTNHSKVWADVTAPHRGEIVRQVFFFRILISLSLSRVIRLERS